MRGQAGPAAFATTAQSVGLSSASYGQDAAAGHVANVNGISTYYETEGTGAPLLLIHENSGSIHSMRCQIASFSRSRRLIIADSRAHGKTEGGTDHLTYELMADDLAALLDAIQVFYSKKKPTWDPRRSQ